jgi:large conductance mechanosensitive channel
MRLLKEFREFAIKGNVLDLTVGVSIGAALNKMLNSLVEDLMTPLITRTKDISNLAVGPFKMGSFSNNLLQTFVTAFVLFLIVKAANRLKRSQEKAPEPVQEDPVVKQIAQNERIIELLETIAAKG